MASSTPFHLAYYLLYHSRIFYTTIFFLESHRIGFGGSAFLIGVGAASVNFFPGAVAGLPGGDGGGFGGGLGGCFWPMGVFREFK